MFNGIHHGSTRWGLYILCHIGRREPVICRRIVLDIQVLTNGPRRCRPRNCLQFRREIAFMGVLEGTVNSWAFGSRRKLVLRVGNNDIRAKIFRGGEDPPNFPLNSKVRVSGVYPRCHCGGRFAGSWHVAGFELEGVRPVPPWELAPKRVQRSEARDKRIGGTNGISGDLNADDNVCGGSQGLSADRSTAASGFHSRCGDRRSR